MQKGWKPGTINLLTKAGSLACPSTLVPSPWEGFQARCEEHNVILHGLCSSGKFEDALQLN